MALQSHFDSSDLSDQLAIAEIGEDELSKLAQRLRMSSESARDNQENELAQCSDIFAQLLDLAAASFRESGAPTELGADVVEYVRDNVEVLQMDRDGTNVETVQDVISGAFANWSEYLDGLDSLQDGQLTVAEPWSVDDSDDADQSGEILGNDNDGFVLDSKQSKEQLEIMLSALQDADGDVQTNDPDSSEPCTIENTSDISSASESDELAELLKGDDLREAFLDDATRGLDSMEKCSLSVEQDENDQAAIIQFCRELHTIKGASASVGLSTLASSIHEVESALADKTDRTNDETVELMLGVVDRVRNVISQIATPTGNGEDNVGNSSKTGRPENRPTIVFGGPSASDDSLIRIRASQLDRLMDMLAELVVLRNRRESHVADFGDFNEELTRCVSRMRFCEDTQVRETPGLSNSSGTLTEIAKDISVLADNFRQLQSPVSKDNMAISHFIRDFRQELMQVRRIPLSGLFNRIQRSARDAAKSEGKQLRFEISGGDSGLERELQEKLFEPLLHIVRNAVSHGIEIPEKRQQVGKTDAGKLTIQAKTNSQMLVITIQDDGQGLNFETIRHRAIEKGLIGNSEFPGEAELAKLIFHPGFSTCEKATEISGRGVGMDVVKTTVEQMRGRIEIDSEAGKGTSMTLIVPMQSGIEHVMVFRSAGQLFALPMQAVAKVKNGGNVASDSGCVTLNSVLSLRESTSNGPTEILFLNGADRISRRRVKVGRTDGEQRQVGFVVDEILGPEEVVIRNLPTLLKPHPLFCGLTLSGAGETVLLLDANRLENFSENFEAFDQEERAAGETTSNPSRILVVDDSLSARKSLVKKLVEHGFCVSEAADGLEGLEKLRNDSFDLVFTDLDMPRLGGLEMLFDLQQGRNKDQAVVVVSSRSENNFKQRAMELGALDYLIKPVNDQLLNQLLGDLDLIQSPNEREQR